MDIEKPDISRKLAIMIQPVPGNKRSEFIRLAKAATSMEGFEKNDYPGLLVDELNMVRHESILARLAPLLTNQTENVATDALSHLLMQYDFLRDALRNYLSPTGVSIPNDLRIKTQARWQDPSIPDLVGFDSDDNCRLVVEAKFGAPLTKNQPKTYLNRLRKDNPGILLFIAPKSRLKTLWHTILNRMPIQPEDITPSAGKGDALVWHRTTETHILALASWESLLESFRKVAIQNKNEHASSDIWQLLGLCQKLDEEAFLPLTDDDLVTPTEKRIFQFRRIIDAVVSLLVGGEIASTAGYNASPGPNYYRSYLSFVGLPRCNWSLEYNGGLKARCPTANLWISVDKSRSHSIWIREAIGEIDHLGKRLYIPLNVPTDVEFEDAVNCIYLQAASIRMKLLETYKGEAVPQSNGPTEKL